MASPWTPRLVRGGAALGVPCTHAQGLDRKLGWECGWAIRDLRGGALQPRVIQVGGDVSAAAESGTGLCAHVRVLGQVALLFRC